MSCIVVVILFNAMLISSLCYAVTKSRILHLKIELKKIGIRYEYNGCGEFAEVGDNSTYWDLTYKRRRLKQTNQMIKALRNTFLAVWLISILIWMVT